MEPDAPVPAPREVAAPVEPPGLEAGAAARNASKARVETELNRVRREALVLVDDFHANGMARSREGDEGAAAAYNDAGRDLSSLLGQSLDRSSRGTPSSSVAEILREMVDKVCAAGESCLMCGTRHGVEGSDTSCVGERATLFTSPERKGGT
jgi:hypothetical protein